MSLEQLINDVAKREAKYGETLSPPATLEDLSLLQEQSLKKYNYTLPDDYIDILKIVNGISTNGVELYASKTIPIVNYPDRFIKGFMEANGILKDSEINMEFIFFAENGDDHYVHNIIKDKFQIIDRATNDVIEQFTSANNLFEELLMSILQS